MKVKNVKNLHFRSSVQAQLKRKHPDSGGEDSCGSNSSSSNGDEVTVTAVTTQRPAAVTSQKKALRHELDDHVTDTVGVVVLDRFVSAFPLLLPIL